MLPLGFKPHKLYLEDSDSHAANNLWGHLPAGQRKVSVAPISPAIVIEDLGAHSEAPTIISFFIGFSA